MPSRLWFIHVGSFIFKSFVLVYKQWLSLCKSEGLEWGLLGTKWFSIIIEWIRFCLRKFTEDAEKLKIERDMGQLRSNFILKIIFHEHKWVLQYVLKQMAESGYFFLNSGSQRIYYYRIQGFFFINSIVRHIHVWKWTWKMVAIKVDLKGPQDEPVSSIKLTGLERWLNGRVISIFRIIKWVK